MRSITFPRLLKPFKSLINHFQMKTGCFYSLDQTQVKLMEEECIIVDRSDQNIGTTSKKNCHLLLNIEKGLLHRAFSVFLFNSKNELLLQQRSAAKITYPNHWTNTCCSHPLNRPEEINEEEAIGVKNAAIRKLNHELGILPDQVPIDSLTYLTRIHYKSNNVPDDGTFGEHEIDYILVARRDVQLVVNANEVSNYEYVDQERLTKMIEDPSLLITPWFRLICKHFLTKWWSDLDCLQQHQDHHLIHRM